MDFGNGGLSAMQELVSLPRWPEGTSKAAQLDLLREEAVITDEFMAYAYAYDNRDLDRVLGFFADDCVIHNPRGEVSGADAIRANYLVLFGHWPLTRHVWSNVSVRFLDATPTEACIGAYHYAVLISDERKLAGIGTDVRRLRKVGDTWKITHRWITDDADYSISLFDEPVENPQKVAEILDEARS